MSPVIQRVADCLTDTFSPFQEFLFIGSVSCNELLIYTAGTHEAPFVMIAAKPYLGNIVEFAVICYFCRIDVAVIVKNRCFFSIVVKKAACSFCLKQEILIHKIFHGFCLLV